jgi:hypothetical protein
MPTFKGFDGNFQTVNLIYHSLYAGIKADDTIRNRMTFRVSSDIINLLMAFVPAEASLRVNGQLFEGSRSPFS